MHIKRNEITKRSLITELLVENSLEFNTRKKMITELENLYNSYFYPDYPFYILLI